VRGGEVLLGGWMVTADADVAGAMARSGCTFVGVDQQHGTATTDTTRAMVASISRVERAHSLVRIPSPDHWMVEQALDSGADGVVVPMIESPTAARRMVDACRFPPEGRRSFGSRTPGALRFHGDVAAANAAVLCVVMVESAAGVDQVERICAESSVDAVYVGLGDLALSLGLGPGMEVRDGSHAQALERVARACRHHGVAWGTHETASCGREELIQMGAQLVTVCTDLALIEQGARDALDLGA
jgi:4-hydroxy-2-oxoheptanedioate aldolase